MENTSAETAAAVAAAAARSFLSTRLVLPAKQIDVNVFIDTLYIIAHLVIVVNIVNNKFSCELL